MCSHAPPEVLAELRKKNPQRAAALTWLATRGLTDRKLTPDQWSGLTGKPKNCFTKPCTSVKTSNKSSSIFP